MRCVGHGEGEKVAKKCVSLKNVELIGAQPRLAGFSEPRWRAALCFHVHSACVGGAFVAVARVSSCCTLTLRSGGKQTPKTSRLLSRSMTRMSTAFSIQSIHFASN